MDDTDIATTLEEAHRQAALSRMFRPRPASGDGTCRMCGEAVESERLAVLPNTHHCSECAAAVEDDRARAQKVGR